jgi:hypothetical protein
MSSDDAIDIKKLMKKLDPCPWCGRKLRRDYLRVLPFCTQECAARFGIGSHRAGYRRQR